MTNEILQALNAATDEQLLDIERVIQIRRTAAAQAQGLDQPVLMPGTDRPPRLDDIRPGMTAAESNAVRAEAMRLLKLNRGA